MFHEATGKARQILAAKKLKPGCSSCFSRVNLYVNREHSGRSAILSRFFMVPRGRESVLSSIPLFHTSPLSSCFNPLHSRAISRRGGRDKRSQRYIDATIESLSIFIGSSVHRLVKLSRFSFTVIVNLLVTIHLTQSGCRHRIADKFSAKVLFQ